MEGINELFVALLVLAVVEMALSGLWVPFYFRVGIPVFAEKRPLSVAANALPPAERLAGALDSRLMAPLLVRSLGPREYAFREKVLVLRLASYTPVMHGLLRLDPATSTLRVTGRANWTMLGFLALCVWWAAAEGPVGLLVAASVLVALIYLLQAWRFGVVLEKAAEALRSS